MCGLAGVIFRRNAEVDSEILFRLAANAARDGTLGIKRFKARLRCENLTGYSVGPFEFIAQERKRFLTGRPGAGNISASCGLGDAIRCCESFETIG